jgi:hypothetical protein
VKAPDTIIVGGHAYSWRALLELRRAHIDAWREAQPKQPALFDLKEDRRPVAERTADGRYREPSLLDTIRNAGG